MGRPPNIPQQLKCRPFSLDEARAAGITLSALRGKAWERVASKLYRWNGRAADPWGVIIGFARTLPPGTVFIKRTAAWMHGLDVEPLDPVQVAVGHHCALRSRIGLAITHTAVEEDREVIRGLPVTNIARTLLDICVGASPVEALIMFDMAVNLHLVSNDELCGYADASAGRPGAARMRRLAQWAAPAESPMETRLRWLLIQGGLPEPQVQEDLRDSDGRFVGRADLYYPAAHLVIEFDGGNHRDRLVSDNRRQNLLVGAGYQVLRFTSADVHRRAGAIVAQVRAALASRSR